MRCAFFVYLAFNMSLIFSSCKKPCQAVVFQYRGSDIFFPEKDSVNINDTIFLSCRILKSELPDHLTDVVNLGGNLIESNIDSFKLGSRGSVADFTYNNLKGRLYVDAKLDPTNTSQISYLETDSSYSLFVGIIPKKSGSYLFTFADVPDVKWSGGDRCGTGDMFFDNININKHLYLIENRWATSLSNRDSETSYCFVVK